MATLYTLDNLHAKEPFDYWHEVVCSTLDHFINNEHRLLVIC